MPEAAGSATGKLPGSSLGETSTPPVRVTLELEDGSRFPGVSFGHVGPSSGEVVFTTGMVGYELSLTDPSFRGQILVCTYPLIGNYGVPASPASLESDRVQVAGLVVGTLSSDTTHAGYPRCLHDWLAGEGIPGVHGIDTRALTLRLRERGTMLGRLLPEGTAAVDVPMKDPNRTDVVAEVSTRAPLRHDAVRRTGASDRPPRVLLVDCGAKRSIVGALVERGVEVLQVPHDHDYTGEAWDGVLVSNGPGNPEQCRATIAVLKRALALGKPVFGICLGAQLLALASGARTYKLRYGHRGQNQPCREAGTPRCVLTSQNHGYAIDPETLPTDWEVWFTNANDGSVEGIRHRRRPFSAVQFHPEAHPGPRDTDHLFDRFVAQLGGVR